MIHKVQSFLTSEYSKTIQVDIAVACRIFMELLKPCSLIYLDIQVILLFVGVSANTQK